MTTKPTIEAAITGSGHVVTTAEWNTNVVQEAAYVQEVLAGTNADKIPATALAGGAAVPTGSLMPYTTGTTDPSGWLLCDGRAVSRSTYSALFAVSSTNFGAGDGSTTFNIPDLRGRFPMGSTNFGTAAGDCGLIPSGLSMGVASGEDIHTLTTAELAVHTHSTVEAAHTHVQHLATSQAGSNGGQFVPQTSSPSTYSDTATTPAMNTSSTSTGITVANNGSGTAHNNRPLSLTLRYIIKT